MNTNFSALIYFPGDPSVGIFSYSYKMELGQHLPDMFRDEPELRDEFREKIKTLYAEMDGESVPGYVTFSDEDFDL